MRVCVDYLYVLIFMMCMVKADKSSDFPIAEIAATHTRVAYRIDYITSMQAGNGKFIILSLKPHPKSLPYYN